MKLSIIDARKDTLDVVGSTTRLKRDFSDFCVRLSKENQCYAL